MLTILQIDTLVNNAGASFDHDLASGKITMREAWNKAWDVNVTGAYITAWTFAPLLVKASESAATSTNNTRHARLLFLGSGTASIAETTPGDSLGHLTQAPSAGWPKTDLGFDVTAYRSSKTGLNMMMRQWERIFQKDSVLTFSISPAFLVTGLGNAGEAGREIMEKMGAQGAHLGGEFIGDVVEGKRDGDAGLAIASDRVQPW